jgi:hypothetical protein
MKWELLLDHGEFIGSSNPMLYLVYANCLTDISPYP